VPLKEQKIAGSLENIRRYIQIYLAKAKLFRRESQLKLGALGSLRLASYGGGRVFKRELLSG